ncbi:HAMP domain-containing histidine kinase [Pseudenhygromyxa sp. WMMC2535]|uniref:sensor histidine kinase n=1 Tax=Pseudenhygromyxa sp. WMMC2535 TaxID=2712867 RepID=UPI0015566F78|nr:HAMP domain-containing sensor histidine kinase [Pseudenhygromyxa sp. WMMC2535]NVB38022.1 HAMP domain-containing histidine kinase [Pseudenhygromyxa sp. WMMC2535]
MVAPKRRSISLPIILSSVAVVLTATLLFGWIFMIARNMESVRETIGGNYWLLVGGIVSFATVISVIVLFTVFLIREIGEVRRQTGFIDSVTHELRTPLASLRLAAETLARPELAADRREQLRRMMLDDVERLSALVDGILDASRLSSGSREPGDLDEVDVGELVEDVVRELAVRHHLEAARVEVEVEAELSFVVDPHALRTVVLNLVDNAIKYSSSEPRICVAVRRCPGDKKVELAVSDQGIGIAKGDLKRIFERFYRVPEEAVRSRHGTGLGLFVVSALVKAMGGKVEASSPGEGEGTTFRVFLPLRDARA